VSQVENIGRHSIVDMEFIWLKTWVMLAAIPLIVLLRVPTESAQPAEAYAAMV